MFFLARVNFMLWFTMQSTPQLIFVARFLRLGIVEDARPRSFYWPSLRFWAADLFVLHLCFGIVFPINIAVFLNACSVCCLYVACCRWCWILRLSLLGYLILKCVSLVFRFYLYVMWDLPSVLRYHPCLGQAFAVSTGVFFIACLYVFVGGARLCGVRVFTSGQVLASSGLHMSVYVGFSLAYLCYVKKWCFA